MLREFDEIVPGTSERLMRWVEDEQSHRRSIELEVTAANIAAQQRELSLAETQAQTQREHALYQAVTVRRSDFIGQLLGFVVCAGCGLGAFFLGMSGHEVAAVALAAIPTAAVVQSFRTLFDRKGPQESAKK
ncbi:DUF2335 domain-containing protein [Roseateles sp.]|jgi:uncharacterized membrane protein|uniref:DUF2335 domain-containing protein n=1 Tax=Roseateles sp. TaxID=1971397 RepID=UPI003BA78BB2